MEYILDDLIPVFETLIGNHEASDNTMKLRQEHKLSLVTWLSIIISNPWIKPSKIYSCNKVGRQLVFYNHLFTICSDANSNVCGTCKVISLKTNLE